MVNGALVATGLLLAFQLPTFRTSTRLVQINVVVRDKNGPVPDLAQGDFTITDRGKRREISVFSITRLGPQANAAALPPNTFSNRAQNGGNANGSVTIVLLDALNTLHFGTAFTDLAGPTRFENNSLAYSKIQVMKFVRELDPKNRVAIYALGRSLRVLCDFTSDAAQLQRVLAEYRDSPVTLAEVAEPPASHLATTPEFNAAIDSGNQKNAVLANSDRAGLTFAALIAIANHAADIPGRKNLVWLTASLPFTAQAIARIMSRSNVAIYPVDARGLISSFNPYFRPVGQGEMQELANETGGVAFYNNNDLSTAIRNATDDADETYTLGFYLNSDELDGKFHEVKIRVDRPHVDVRYPSGYFAVKDDSTASQRQRALRNAMASPIESSAIHILAQVDRSAAALRVTGSVDLHDLHLTESGTQRKGAIEFFVTQQDAAGNLLAQSHNRVNLALSPDQFKDYLKSGVFFRQDIAPKNGAVSLRIIAGDPATGLVGSLIIPLQNGN
ncbi:MAG TPA: VWA domain-containing protein [Bryobacteraceae bacterium]|nr:VWA domain-containing protein [Bryobacteraceae bacterium]